MSEWVIWGIFGIAAIVGAFGVVFFTNPVHSALSLVTSLIAVAVLFLVQNAFFMSIVQIIVYTGAIVVMFLFVIMLLGVDRRDTADEKWLYHPAFPFAFVGGVIVLCGLMIAVNGVNWPLGAPGTDTLAAIDADGGNVEAISRLLFTRYLLPFEFVSILVVAGVVGAMVLAKRDDRKLFGSGIGKSAEVVDQIRAGVEAGQADDNEPEGASQ